jgi:asparagine synthetase B (glutamine-hydrolysing)
VHNELTISNLLLPGAPAPDGAVRSAASNSLGVELPLGDVAALSKISGHFAAHERIAGEDVLARDALGVNKLFFAVGSGGVESSNYFIELVKKGHAPKHIWSVPSGHQVRVSPGERKLQLEKFSTLTFADNEPALDHELPEHAARIVGRLENTFARLKQVLAGRPLYVTLSGGLDSTTIAVLAKQYLGPFTAITFAAKENAGAAKSEQGSDLYFARKVAEELGVPLQVVEVPARELPDLLDEVLLYGQDYRDFNVHCGLVNAALARAIAASAGSSGVGSSSAGSSSAGSSGAGSSGVGSSGARPCVLTGDTMNELTADYTPVQYGDAQYYALPDLSPGRLRRFLVAGLDTGDREVGIFAHHGVDTVQPYALCADAYASLPGGFLDKPGAKQQLARLMLGERVPSFIYSRPKVRAQVADSNQVGGTMAALLDRGIDAEALMRRFCDLFQFEPQELKRWIRAGVYRFTAAFPEVG